MKADLHLHSRFSTRAPEWFFRRIGLPDSYSDPRALYDQLKAAGMDLVTLTDHDSIAGCLEIADRPGVFLSQQVTTFFPEDRSVVELLVWGLSESQHEKIQELRENVYELQGFLAEERLAHGVAHPLYASKPLSLGYLEKLTLLFRNFEGINGLRNGLLSEVGHFAFNRLTPAKMEEFSERHRLAPTHSEPWKKAFFGGSDDHGGLFPASAYTETPAGKGSADFLNFLKSGQCEAVGQGGSPLAFSHSLYNQLRQFIGEKVAGAESSSFLGKAFSRFMEGRDPTEFSWTEKLGFLAQGIASGKIFELAKPANMSVWRQFATHFGQEDVKALLTDATKDIAEPERRAFVIANFFANQLAFRFFTRFVQQASSGNLIEAIQDVSVMLPILGTLAPYLYAFRSQSANRRWLSEVSRSFSDELAPPLKNVKRAWFTDTLEDVNGVANTIRKLTAACVEDGRDLIVVTSRSSIQIKDIPIKNFAPIGEFELPEYELQKLSFPPILQMLDFIQRENFTELIISTPGPIGLTALLAAKVLGLRTSGIYHTDFPQYVRILTEDSSLETLTWTYMKWFYDQLDLIYVNSESYRREWIDRGIDPKKFQILPRGLDTALFHPSRRDPAYWSKHGVLPGQTVLLYVGRVSKEKNFDVVINAWNRLRRPDLALAIVGDGPYLKELRQLLPDACFTGYLAGLELATAFASADIFVFPSTTDTFGNVVVEALASGLPNVVSDQGGPQDLVIEGKTGFVTRALDGQHFARAVQRLIDDPQLRAQMGNEAFRAVQNRDWADAGRAFWATSDE